jgi:hypothetical protein
MPRRRVWLSFLKIFGEKLMTKPFTLGDEFENEDSSHLKKNKIVSLLKEKFDFENSHLRPPSSKEKGILAK